MSGNWLPFARRFAAPYLVGFAAALSGLPAWPQDTSAHMVPIFPTADDRVRQGFVRIINHSAEPGEVTIHAFDDTDREFGTLRLALDANGAAHFNSDDLEMGNPEKGFPGGTGAGTGDGRLALASDLDIEVLTYVRNTTDGFLTAMHDTVPREGNVYRVPTFNPGANVKQASRLHLANARDEPAESATSGVATSRRH